MNVVSHQRPIELADEPPFRLGELDIRPATLEVSAGERHEVLEPRVMQVLVALARRRGEMVSREDLNRQCWGGRVVGDDAITRCVSRLRRLSRDLGGFEIETVRRVGVQLTETGTGSRRSSGRARPWLLGTLIVVALLAAAAWGWRHTLAVGPADEPRIAITPFSVIGDEPGAAAFAAALTDDVSGFLGERGVGLAILDAASGGADRADLLFRGSVDREGDRWRVRAYLEDRSSKLTVWSRQFERPVTEERALRDEVAVAATDVAYFAKLPTTQKGLRIAPESLALFIAAMWEFSYPRESLTNPRIRRLFEQVVDREPRFAWAHAAISRNLVDASHSAPPEERAALRRRARAEADLAIRLNRAAVDPAYETLSYLRRTGAPGDLAAAEDELLKGIKASREGPWLHMRECRFLMEVGRAADALRYCQQARALRPLTGVIDISYAEALYATGQVSQAIQAADQSARFHPNHPLSQTIRIGYAVLDEDPKRVRLMFWGAAGKPPGDDAMARLGDLILRARETGASADIDAAVAASWATVRAGLQPAEYHASVVASLGRPDDALRGLEAAGRNAYGGLLNPHLATLRGDPRFWRLAAKAGLVRYWRARDKWPDFCRDPALPFDCRKEAAKVAAIPADL